MDEKIDVNDIPPEVLLKYCIRDLKKSRMEIGKLQSEIQEWEYKYNELKKEKQPKTVVNKIISLAGIPQSEREKALIAFYEEKKVDSLIKKENAALQKRIHRLKGDIAKLIYELNKNKI